ncbi:hypothetical protein AMTRI_Chr13g117890 [Amborella trichopoda]|uniref:C3H1-type domain-containing protein n=1 Tax=Amborella trichopoda TaxID=13333 RepID=W1PBD0_AMBTC|nr:zinc finger CCCH domain-containing protein 15 [Amborella trichopoda]ERN04335.1 hypothetical protein AMTR_s00147p00005450 [Amborella trichopoda]|eukprot:XP_006842660.3 zinc finger CCCH domain-containing protein 15 [Amborella trichopoda]
MYASNSTFEPSLSVSNPFHLDRRTPSPTPHHFNTNNNEPTMFDPYSLDDELALMNHHSTSPTHPLASSTSWLDEQAGSSRARTIRDIAERYGISLGRTTEPTRQVGSTDHLRSDYARLRAENARLKAANADLARRLSLLALGSRTESEHLSCGLSALSMVGDFRRLGVGDGGGTRVGSVPVATDEADETSPTSVLSFEGNGNGGIEKRGVPKSISIRSSGYLKVNQVNGGVRSPNKPNRFRVATPVAETRVCVKEKGATGEEEGVEVEVEVYNQGMFKTELCNKWQETGACPYGDRCQFAHGIEELRPVIRHPRYKTEICRMILTGDKCPYGHRCHFRHALSPNETFGARPSS